MDLQSYCHESNYCLARWYFPLLFASYSVSIYLLSLHQVGCPLHIDFVGETRIFICIFYHFLSLRWHRQLKSFVMEYGGCFTTHSILWLCNQLHWHFYSHQASDFYLNVCAHGHVPSLRGNYNDTIMGTMASQITSRTIVYSTVYSGTDLLCGEFTGGRWIPRTNGQ